MKRRLIAVAVAVLLAAFGSASVLFYVSRTEARVLAGKKAVQVLLATKRIPAGTSGAELRKGAFTETVAMPLAAVPADALGRIDPALDELVLTADLQPRQLLLRGAFGEDAKLAGGLSIPDGKIAVTVDVAGLAAVSFIRAGSQVAIFDIYTPRVGDGRIPSGIKGPQQSVEANHVVRLLMPRVEVLGIGLPGQEGAETTTTSEDPAADGKAAEKRPAASLTAVTFAVTQEEAEKLILAAATTDIYIALLDESSNVRPGLGADTKSLFP
jgi:pilus assembly protein CpaB